MNNKILIVEDEEAFRRLLKASFLEQNFQVLTASNGEDGLKTALTEHPDLIVLDIFLPKMSGTELLEKLRQDKWGKKVPVIILSNINPSELPKDISQFNVVDYRLKVNTSLHQIVEKAKEELSEKKSFY